MVRQGLIPLLMTLSLSATASTTQDVIYKKDGSILKGDLIEQDFENGQYKIQLLGGSVFVIQKDDISKITKEANPNKNVEILVDNSKDKASSRSEIFTPLPASNPYANGRKPTDVVFYFGTLSHAIRFKYNDYYYNREIEHITRYGGFKIGAQKNYSEHVAVQVNLNSGKLNSIEIVDEQDYILQEYSDSELIDEHYLGLSASIIGSTNLQRGWQFYSGLGLMHDEYSSDFGDQTYTSLSLQLGLGYSWETVQLALNYQGAISGDYPSELNVGNFNIQLGINFQ